MTEISPNEPEKRVPLEPLHPEVELDDSLPTSPKDAVTHPSEFVSQLIDELRSIDLSKLPVHIQRFATLFLFTAAVAGVAGIAWTQFDSIVQAVEKTLAHLKEPTPALASATSISIDPTESPRPTHTPTPYSSPIPSSTEAATISATAFFNKDTVPLNELDPDVGAPGIETHIFCLDENGRTIAIPRNSQPHPISANLLICYGLFGGRQRAVSLAGLAGDTILLTGTKNDRVPPAITITITGRENEPDVINQQTVARWSYVNPDPSNPNQIGMPPEYVDWHEYIEDILKSRRLRFTQPTVDYGPIVAIMQQ
jgi:hypothetical protein